MSYIIESNSNKGEQNKDCGIQSIQMATKPRQRKMKLTWPCHDSLCASPHLWKGAKITRFILFWNFSFFPFLALIQVPDQPFLTSPFFSFGRLLLEHLHYNRRKHPWDHSGTLCLAYLLFLLTLLPLSWRKLFLPHALELCSDCAFVLTPSLSSSASRENKGSGALALDAQRHLHFFTLGYPCLSKQQRTFAISNRGCLPITEESH